MERNANSRLWRIALLLAIGGSVCMYFDWPRSEETLLAAGGDFTPVEIQHPVEGAVMPLNMCSPVLAWNTNVAGIERWKAGFKTAGGQWLFENVQPGYHPPSSEWDQIKQSAKSGEIEMVVAGFPPGETRRVQARGSVRFRLDSQAVRYPLFFREVNLPFIDAVKDPSKIRWRFGALDKGKPPPIVLEKMPVCGNCHSFSRDGSVLAMDVDYASSKGSYITTRTAPEMILATSDIITWDDFRKEEKKQTFGLLSQISPDGRYVLSTVQDRSVFVPRPDLAFSQLFFPIKGIIAIYDRETKSFSALPGADDPAFVQSNPTWSPDGQWVVFARNRAAELEKLRDTGSILLTPEECEEFLKRGKEFRFDLYRVPFNHGQGGTPEPIRGASGNGRSNFFPKFSPDGRWIVFCQASNYMLLQPDSQLYIIPSSGGEPRRLNCNLNRMNSWHSWTPDGRWMVFSSKAHSDYTQLYLTRINEEGEASPPVWLEHLVEPGRAANIPEFVNLPENHIVKIREQFLDDNSFTRAGNSFFRAGDPDGAIAKYEQALSLNPHNAMAHQKLGFLLFNVKLRHTEGLPHLREAVRLEPKNPFAQFDLGMALKSQGDMSNAIPHLAEAARLLPQGFDRQYNVVDMNYHLAVAYYTQGRFAPCVKALETVLRHGTNHAQANYLMAMSKAALGGVEDTIEYRDRALKLAPKLAQLPDYSDLLSRNLIKQGRFAEGFLEAEKGWQLALAAGATEQAAKLKERMEYCRTGKSTQLGTP